MFPAISNAVSGMRAASLRLEAAARGIATENISGTIPKGVAAPQVYVLVQANNPGPVAPRTPTGDLPGPIRNVSPAWMAAYDPAEQSVGAGAPRNADLTQSMLDHAIAENDFLANAKTLQVAQDMVKRLFEVTD